MTWPVYFCPSHNTARHSPTNYQPAKVLSFLPCGELPRGVEIPTQCVDVLGPCRLTLVISEAESPLADVNLFHLPSPAAADPAFQVSAPWLSHSAHLRSLCFLGNISMILLQPAIRSLGLMACPAFPGALCICS